MTNAEKYLKEEIDREALYYKLAKRLYNKKRNGYPYFTLIRDFFNEEVNND